MTREEAIDYLNENYPDSCYELLRQAVDKIHLQDLFCFYYNTKQEKTQ